jgi:hypothetical protein
MQAERLHQPGAFGEDMSEWKDQPEDDGDYWFEGTYRYRYLGKTEESKMDEIITVCSGFVSMFGLFETVDAVDSFHGRWHKIEKPK